MGVLVRVDGGGSGGAVSVGEMMGVVWANGLVMGWVAAATLPSSRRTPAALSTTIMKKNNNNTTPARAIVSKLEREERFLTIKEIILSYDSDLIARAGLLTVLHSA